MRKFATMAAAAMMVIVTACGGGSQPAATTAAPITTAVPETTIAPEIAEGMNLTTALSVVHTPGGQNTLKAMSFEAVLIPKNDKNAADVYKQMEEGLRFIADADVSGSGFKTGSPYYEIIVDAEYLLNYYSEDNQIAQVARAALKIVDPVENKDTAAFRVAIEEINAEAGGTIIVEESKAEPTGRLFTDEQAEELYKEMRDTAREGIKDLDAEPGTARAMILKFVENFDTLKTLTPREAIESPALSGLSICEEYFLWNYNKMGTKTQMLQFHGSNLIRAALCEDEVGWKDEVKQIQSIIDSMY